MSGRGAARELLLMAFSRVCTAKPGGRGSCQGRTCCQSRGLVRTCSPDLAVHVAQEGTDIHPPKALVAADSTTIMEIPWMQAGGPSPQACWILSQNLHMTWLPAGMNVTSVTHLGHYPFRQFLFPKGCSVPKPTSLG